METFKRGTVVSLKSGGALLTVESEHTNEAGEKVLVCKHWNKKNDRLETIELFSELVDIDHSNDPPEIKIFVNDSNIPIPEREDAEPF